MNFDHTELLALARDHLEQNRLDEALAKIKTLLVEPEPPAGTRELAARIYVRLRLHDRAITLLKQCLEIEPDSLERRIELAMAHQDGGEQDTALTQWETMLQQNPLLPPALFNAGLIRALRGQVADANRHLEVLLQTAPQDNFYVSRGRELQGKLQEQVALVRPVNN